MNERITINHPDFPGLADALQESHRIIDDIRDRYYRYGSMSRKQATLVIQLAGVIRNPAPGAAPVAAPVGRVEFSGTIISSKFVENQFGGCTKILVKVPANGGAYRVWTTVPSALLDKVDSYVSRLKGAKVTLRATLKHGDCPSFAIGSRPTLADFEPVAE